VLLKTGGFCSVNKYVKSECYHGSIKSKLETKWARWGRGGSDCSGDEGELKLFQKWPIKAKLKKGECKRLIKRH